jgi:hypothetical protein
MRTLLLAAMLLASCGPAYDGCQNVCANGFFGDTQYLCDGGPCPIGSGTAELFDQCLCATPNGQFKSLIYPRPLNQSECDAAKTNWSNFFDANCH